MNTTVKVILLIASLAVVGILLLGVMGMAALIPFRTSVQGTTLSEIDSAPPGGIGLANPASVHCIDQGYVLQMVEDQVGSQIGMCIFPDGSQCEEWAYYRGECGPASGE